MESSRLTLVSALILLAGDLVRPRIHFRNGYTFWFRCIMEALSYCRCQGILGYSKGALRSSWQVCRVVSARLTLMILLILLSGALVCPWIHLRDGYTCWSRYSVEALTNYRCQTFVEDKKGALRRSWKGWMGVSTRSMLVSVLIVLAGAMVRPRSHLSNSCTCWS